MRLFAALELPERLRHDLARVRGTVCGVDPSWCGQKWVAEENLHITVRFFGEVPEDDVDRVLACVGEAAEGLEPPRLAEARLVATPSARRARMLWVEWRQRNEAAGLLAEELRRLLPEYGPPVEKTFRAHATVCRARNQQPIQIEALESAAGALSAAQPPMSVPVASVISSRLTPRGPVYATIGTRHFGGQ